VLKLEKKSIVNANMLFNGMATYLEVIIIAQSNLYKPNWLQLKKDRLMQM
jgi:hypothetical protein